jgi:hypothetical protein
METAPTAGGSQTHRQKPMESRNKEPAINTMQFSIDRKRKKRVLPSKSQKPPFSFSYASSAKALGFSIPRDEPLSNPSDPKHQDPSLLKQAEIQISKAVELALAGLSA